jgi:hypothetical protein
MRQKGAEEGWDRKVWVQEGFQLRVGFVAEARLLLR